MEKSKHMKTLWSILSGTNQPSSLDVVGPFVEGAKDWLISGLQHFRTRGEDSSLATNTFSTILGHAIQLKAEDTSELLDSYRKNEYRGTADQFESLLKNKHIHPGLLAELCQFYQKERLYLLHCIEFLIKKAHNTHPYSNIFEGFLEAYNSKGELKKSLLTQLKMLSESNPPQQSGLVTPAMIKLWWSSHSQEILLVLQCLMHYSEIHSLDAEDFLEILSTCGKLSCDMEESFHSVWHMQAALLVKVVQSKHNFQAFRLKNTAIEEELERISNIAEYSPLLLAWMLNHYTSETPISGSKFQQFGEKAIEQRALKIIADIGNDTIFQGESTLRETVCRTLNNLLAVLVSSFDTERLASQADLRSATCSVLRGSSRAAENFWTPDQGLNFVWSETVSQFPLEMVALLELSKAAAHYSNENKIKICREIQELPNFMEPIENIPDSSLKWTTAGVVVLLQTHYPYKNVGCKEVLLPRGAMGSVDGKYIRWQVKVNFYEVALTEIQMLLQQASFGLSAVKFDTITRVQQVLSFLELIFPQLDNLAPIYAGKFRQLILSLVERFGPLSIATHELLANSLKCLAAAVTKSNASDVAGKLFSTSVLPSVDRQLPSVVTGSEILPGVIGTVLAGVECSQGSYPLTAALVKLTSAFIQADLADERVAVPCNLFILREVLPFLLTRQYVSLGQRDLMIGISLNWLHLLLQTDSSNQVRQMCARILLDSPRGEAESVVTIAAFGSALAEMQLIKQTDWEDREGHGQVLLRHIRLSLSILNVLLNDREAAGRMSPLETLLSSPSSAGQHFTTVLAHYIFYRFDLRLATLALKVLKSCANRWKNVSLLACLGHDASLIRNTWLDSLESNLEDAGLIRNILRLMTDSVASQPGLMHMLVNGDDRCFRAVTRLLLESKELEALELVHQFWFQRCSPAIEYFKEQPNFWPQLCLPLLTSDKDPELKRIALLFQILAIELYNTCGKKVNAELQTVLNQLPSHLTDWSDLVLNSLPSSSSPAGKDKTSLDFLLSGWSDFLVMLAHYGPATEVGTRAKISTDVLESLIGRAESGHHSPLIGKLAELNWMLQLVEKKSNSQMLSGLGRLLVVVAEKELTSFPARFQVAVLTSAVSALRLRSETDTDKKLSTWMRPVSLCVQSCLIQLPKLLLTEINNPNSRATCITALCLSLLTELLPAAQDLSAMQETFLLQSLISTIQFCIHHRRGWEVAETALAVLLAVARTDTGSAVLTQLQLDQTLWLPLEAIYEAQPTVYRLGLQLCTTVLGRQRHFFLEQALTLAGVHQQPITNILLKLRHPSKDDLLLAIDVMALLRQLSVFQQTWRLQHSGSMQGVLQAASSAVYYGIAHLIRAGSLSPIMGTTFVDGKDSEATQPSPAVMELQSQLLELVSQGLAMLNCYNPPLAALLTEDGIDVAKWERHLSPSFSTPSLDHLEASPSLSFGTLNAVASHTLRILSKPDQQPNQRNHLTMVLEQSLSLLLSQALLYILDPRLCAQEKQLLKRELGAELGSFVESIRRQAQRGLRSPAVASTTPRPVSSTVHQSFLKLVGHIVQRIFK